MTGSPASEMSVKSGAGSPSDTKRASSRRAVGVVRVSRVGGREGETFVTESEQEERIRLVCSRDGLELAAVYIESNVSGGAPLERRSGLRPAVEMVEAGAADVVVVAYFDRLVRSLAVQSEVVARVERAGGAILAVDVGEVRADTASRWLSSTMLGLVAEYHRRTTAERTAEAKRRAVARGVPTFAKIPPGYRLVRKKDEKGFERVVGVERDPETVDAVVKAWTMRAEGATINECRAYLREHGVARSFHGVQAMFASRFYLGELRFGALENLASHEPIIDRPTWQHVQRMRSPRGRRATSDRLLARLGVLRCATCGARMVVGTAHHGEYALYRCPPVGDCPRRVTISAQLAESVVVDAVKDYLRDAHGSASVDDHAATAERELADVEHELDAAVRAFSALDDVDVARERLAALRDRREAARARVEELRAAQAPALTITAGEHWDDLSRDAQRALIRAVLDRADVAPGRGRDRISVHPRGE